MQVLLYQKYFFLKQKVKFQFKIGKIKIIFLHFNYENKRYKVCKLHSIENIGLINK